MPHPLTVIPPCTQDSLKPAEVARRFGRSTSWVYDRLTAGGLRAVKRDGRTAVCADSVNALLGSRRAARGRPKLRLVIDNTK